MKKIFITMIVALVMSFGFNANAQVEPAKFFDNTSIVLKGGANTSFADPFDKVNGQVGVEVEKGITPWLGFALDGTMYMNDNDDRFDHTVHMVNVNALAKFNLRNMFGTFDGKRHTFEPSVFTGIGWGHLTQREQEVAYWNRNFMVYKAGVDFDFNLGKEKAWAIRIQPAVVWGCPNAGKLNINNGWMELNAGIVYHFKNHDGNRTFTLVKRYDQNEVDNLNGRINALREENAQVVRENEVLKTRLAEVPVTVAETVTVTDTVMLMPRVQFYVNSARLVETSLGNVIEMADYMKANTDKTYTIIGYASVEGGEAYNEELSERRATTLRDKLVEFGVDVTQLEICGAGATDKFSTDCRTLNRVVIVEENKR